MKTIKIPTTNTKTQCVTLYSLDENEVLEGKVAIHLRENICLPASRYF